MFRCAQEKCGDKFRLRNVVTRHGRCEDDLEDRTLDEENENTAPEPLPLECFECRCPRNVAYEVRSHRIHLLNA